MFGIVLVIFSAFAGVINYELDKTMYLSTAPVLLIETSIVTAMLPYLVGAVLSLFVANIISRSMDSEEEEETEKEAEKTEAQTKEEADFDKMATT